MRHRQRIVPGLTGSPINANILAHAAITATGNTAPRVVDDHERTSDEQWFENAAPRFAATLRVCQLDLASPLDCIARASEGKG
jgi:hypothetical protein